MKPAAPSAPRALRPRQIREIYGIPPSTLRDLILCGRLPSVKLPGRKGNKGSRLVLVSDIEALLARHRG
jgi:hypothetical protein